MGIAGNTLDMIRTVFKRDSALPVGPSYFDSINSSAIAYTNATLGPQANYNEHLTDSVKLDQDLMSRYADYENMDDFPELGAALTLYADDATTQDVLTNRSIWFEADDTQVETILNDLLTVNLKAEESLWEVCRNLCKYGNNFEEIMAVDGTGVVKLNHHPSPSMRRIEDVNGILYGYIHDPTMMFQMDTKTFLEKVRDKGEMELKPYDHTAQDMMKVYEPWEMVHFRLRGKSRRDLYGYSILEPARWAYKRLSMIEDAMVLYKLCLRGDSRIWTPHGYTKIRDLKEGDLVYCFDDSEVKVTSVTYHKCNGKDAIYRVSSEYRELHANETHPVLVHERELCPTTGGYLDHLKYVEVRNLDPEIHSFVTPPVPSNEGELTPIYTHNGLECGYMEHEPNFVKLLGFMSMREYLSGIGFYAHENDNKTMEYKRYFEEYFDCVMNYTDEGEFGVYYTDLGQVVAKYWQNGGQPLSFPSWLYSASYFTRDNFLRGVISAVGLYRETPGRRYASLEVESYFHALQVRELAMQMGLAVTKIKEEFEMGRLDDDGKAVRNPKTIYEFEIDYRQQSPIDPILSIEEVEEDSIWDIGVESKAHNFIADGVVVHNTRSPQRYAYYVDVGDVPPNQAKGFVNQIKNEFKKHKFINPMTNKPDFKYNPLSQDEDLFLPVRKGKRSTEVEVLSGPEGQQIDDAEYFLNKIFASLLIPKSYLGGDETIGRANLSQMDVRFCRSVLRIQREMKNGYSQVGRVHLSAKNIDPDQLKYECMMNTPSGVFELAQMEVQTAKLELADKYRDANFDEYYIWSNILGMSDEDINEIQQRRAGAENSDLNDEESGRMKEVLPKAIDKARQDVDKKALAKTSEILAEIKEGNTKFAKKMKELRGLTCDIKHAINRKSYRKR